MYIDECVHAYGEERVKTIKCKDDQAVLVASQKELQFIIKTTVRARKEFTTRRNIRKTKEFRISKNQGSVDIAWKKKLQIK